MGVEESVFAWLYRLVAGLGRREPSAEVERGLETAALMPRLRVLAGAGAGRSLELRIVDGPGGLAGDTVLLPRRLGLLATREENERLLLVRATLAGALVRAGLGDAAPSDEELESKLPGIERALAEELPGWATMRAALPADLTMLALTGRLLPGPPRSPESVTAAAETQTPERPRTEREGKKRGPPKKKRRLVEEERPENPFTHSFEKVHTAEDHHGGSKRADGSDELDDHLAALDELELDEVVLSNERTQSVYRADALFSAGELGEAGSSGGLRYDEWDPRARKYLARYCALRVECPEVDLAAGEALRARVMREERRTYSETRAELARLDTALRWHTRQPDGPDIDLDALVERSASLLSGHEGPTRLYMSRRKRGHSVSLLILLDASSSTDGWVANRRLLDLERDAATIVTLAFDGIVGELALGAFCSFSRDDCRFVALKSFHESTARGLARLARLEPRGYTRIGPALRHATEALAATSSRRKAILLLSDGQPTDTDRYEGRHGIGDVRQAVREASLRGVEVFALAADPRSKPILPQMFGTRGHAGLASTRDVARATGLLVSELLR